jgi:hypothetical protein
VRAVEVDAAVRARDLDTALRSAAARTDQGALGRATPPALAPAAQRAGQAEATILDSICRNCSALAQRT